MKYKNFNEVPAHALAGVIKDLLSKLQDGTIPFEVITALLRAPKNVRKEIAGLLKIDVLETVKDKLAQFGDIARSKGIRLYYDTPTGTDPDIMNWIPNATVSTIAAPQGNWKKVDTQNGTTESEMLKTAIIMPLSCAVDTFIAELQKGTFDTLSTYRIIFLEEKDAEGRALKLVCGRDGDGELSLCVVQVRPARTWDGADDAWLQQQ